MKQTEMNQNCQQGRLFCVTGVKAETEPVNQYAIGYSTPAKKPIVQSETESSGYVSSSSFESSGEEKRLKLNEQKVFQVWEKWGQQMQIPKFSTPKSPRTARKCHQRPSSLGDMSAITGNHPKSSIKIKKFGGENKKTKRVVIKSLSDEVKDIYPHTVHKAFSDGALNQPSRVALSERLDPVGRPSDKVLPTQAGFSSRERRDSSSSSRSCGSGQSDYSDYNSLPRQRGKYDGRLNDDDEYSLAKQVARSCDCIYDKGVSVDESMSEFLSKVNKENLESLLNFYDRVTANEKRRKQKNYEAVYY